MENNTTTKPLNQSNMENTYNPFKPNLEYIKRKWKQKICAEDKGGSFNVALYNDYLDIINNQPIYYVPSKGKKA